MYGTYFFFIKNNPNNCCPYCGRQYVNHFYTSNGTIYHTAQVDHFLPKSIYTFLSISIRNMIPICGFCNNKKSDYDSFINMSMVNPSLIKENDIIFKLVSKKSKREFISVKDALDNIADLQIDLSSIKYQKEIKKTNEKIYLKAIYQTHIDEIIELLKKLEKCNDYYLDNLINQGLFTSKEEIKSFMFGDILYKNNASSPLLKLKRDVLMRFMN